MLLVMGHEGNNIFLFQTGFCLTVRTPCIYDTDHGPQIHAMGLIPIWNRSGGFLDELQKSPYETKLYEQKTVNVQADYLPLHFCFCVSFVY